MQFRFTLSNTIAGSQVINEPDGWKDIEIKLERDNNFHSIVEMVDSAFFYYNANSLVDGGRTFLSNVETTQGLNAIVTLLIELSEDVGVTWDTVFTGNLDLSTIKDLSRGDKFYRFQCAVIPSSLWSTFLNRRSAQVDLLSTTDLDGNAVAAPTKLTLILPNQKVRLTYQADLSANYTYDDIAAGRYIQFDFDEEPINEIGTKFHLPTDINTTIPDPLWTLDFAGDYVFGIRLIFSANGTAPGAGLDVYLRVINVSGGSITDYAFTKAVYLVTSTEYTLSLSVTLNKGDSIVLYGLANTAFTVGIGNSLIRKGGIDGSGYLTRAFNTGDTTYPDSTAEALLVHDAASSLTKRITGSAFNFYSDYLGGTTQGYGSNGCGYLNALLLGLHVRGYALATKPFAMSFDDWWAGMNPIFCLGIGPETVSGVEKLRCEPLTHYYNDTIIVRFDNVNDIERTYDQQQIVKSVRIGYQTWSAESGSGIDDPQTVHTYSTIYKIIGQDISLVSGFVAASLNIEQTRRNSKESGKDWRMDNNTFIINLSSTTSPEVDTPFTTITNLLNATTRYNVRFTVYRNFQRWLKYLSGCLQPYLTSKFKFTSGEGNYTTVVGANSDTCDTGTWTENQDISPSSTPYFTPQMYTVTVPMSWATYKILKANRYNAIGISPTDTGHKTCHIQSGRYAIQKGRATFQVWIK